MPSTLKKCGTVGCFENALCCFGHCAVHCDVHCRNHTIGNYSRAPMPRREPSGCHGFLGMEFEVIPRLGRGRDMLAKIARHVTEDCSVRGSHGAGAECKFLSWCDRAPATVSGWLQRLHAAKGGCPVTVNRSCSVHVHLDSRGLLGHRIIGFATAMQSAGSEWRDLMPESRRENQYVQWNSGIHDRYSWINLRRHTVELRLHPGTVNPNKAAAWIGVCCDLIHLMRGTDPIPARLGPFAPGIFSEASREYLTARRDSGGAL